MNADINLTLADICREYDIALDRLLSDEKTTRVALARVKAAWLLVNAGFRRAEVAKALGRSERMINKMISTYAIEHKVEPPVNRIEKANAKHDTLVEMFRQNIPLKRIAEATGYSYGSVRTIASRLRKEIDLPDARRRD